MAIQHDASYKKLFSSPALVRELIAGFLPHPWLEAIDFCSLESMATSLVDDRNQERRADVLWRVKVAEEWRYLFILLEFQSTVDHAMALRMMTYVGGIYQNLLRSNTISTRHPFPPILPIVLCNGDRAWTSPAVVEELIHAMPAPFADCVPRMRHVVIDMSHYHLKLLKQRRNLVACLVRAERLSDDELDDLVGDMIDWLPSDPELERTIATWLRAILFNQSGGKMLSSEVQDLRGFRMGLKESIERKLRESREQGREEGEARVLHKLLISRFGSLPAHVVNRIRDASPGQLDLWLSRLLRADSLDEVFKP